MRSEPTVAAALALLLGVSLLGPTPAARAASGSCDSHTNVETGAVTGTGDAVIVPADGYHAFETTHSGCLDGDDGLDVDLTLMRGTPGGASTPVATSDGPGSQEELQSYQAEGDFYWIVTSESGAGSFTLGWTLAVPGIYSPVCGEFDHEGSGTLVAAGDSMEMPAGGYVTGDVLRHEACVEGSPDLDLHLARIEEDGSRTIVASGDPVPLDYGGTSTHAEQLRHSDGPGRYVWIVERVSGSGSFTFGYSTVTPPPVSGCEHFTQFSEGALDTTGDTDTVVVMPASVQPGGTIEVCLSWASGTAMTAELQRDATGDGAWSTVASGSFFEHTADGGWYRVVVRSDRGAGDYHLGLNATPNTTITDGPRATTAETNAYFSYSADKPVHHFRCSLDGAAWQTCFGLPQYEDLALGEHTFRVKAVDAAGLEDLTPAVWRWRIVEPAPAPAPAPAPTGSELFDDVRSGNIFDTSIGRLAAVGVTRGCNPPHNTRFCPDAFVTRGQMAAFLDRALRLPDGDVSFSDTAGSIFEANVAALAAAGVTRGCNPPENTRFCPDAFVTREQMAAFLDRAGLLD